MNSYAFETLQRIMNLCLGHTVEYIGPASDVVDLSVDRCYVDFLENTRKSTVAAPDVVDILRRFFWLIYAIFFSLRSLRDPRNRNLNILGPATNVLDLECRFQLPRFCS